jgi:hypothetical protein
VAQGQRAARTGDLEDVPHWHGPWPEMLIGLHSGAWWQDCPSRFGPWNQHPVHQPRSSQRTAGSRPVSTSRPQATHTIREGTRGGRRTGAHAVRGLRTHHHGWCAVVAAATSRWTEQTRKTRMLPGWRNWATAASQLGASRYASTPAWRSSRRSPPVPLWPTGSPDLDACGSRAGPSCGRPAGVRSARPRAAECHTRWPPRNPERRSRPRRSRAGAPVGSRPGRTTARAVAR